MKQIRMILPAIAIVFAVAASFVTIASPNDDPIRVTDDAAAPCNAIGTCLINLSASQTCEQAAQVQLVQESNCTTPVNEKGMYTEFQ